MEDKFIPTPQMIEAFLSGEIVKLKPRYFEGFKKYWNPLANKKEDRPWPYVKRPKDFADKPLIFEEED